MIFSEELRPPSGISCKNVELQSGLKVVEYMLSIPEALGST
jgi:hypothetical protein